VKVPFGIPAGLSGKILRLRRLIHEHPELSHEERETTARVRAELEAEGLTDIRGAAGTGLVVTIGGRDGGKTLALRADLDALPLREESDVPFASKRPGGMHACGHDAHTAILAGVAIALHHTRQELAGTVRCIFQPAEESEPLGARKIVSEGHVAGVDGILALHVHPGISVGQVGVRQGPLMACAGELSITIEGRSVHGALPHLGVDAIAVAAAIIQELQKIPSRRIDPLEPALITIGKIQGGTVRNVIADRVQLDGIVRTLDEDVRKAVGDMVRDVACAIAEVHGARARVEFISGEPVLRNDPALTAIVSEAAREILGPAGVYEIPRPQLLAEDFAFYLERVPGVMFWLGVRNDSKGIIYPLHDSRFTLDEDALLVGAAVLLRAVHRFFGEGLVGRET
jgi:amidohydrolase